ncbi:hypothetical protein AMC89_CH02651 [Rhizobium phaseoli]|nr:hypothetical protein AMC89_CH02651 [Rhizobium phaseoli]
MCSADNRENAKFPAKLSDGTQLGILSRPIIGLPIILRHDLEFSISGKRAFAEIDKSHALSRRARDQLSYRPSVLGDISRNERLRRSYLQHGFLFLNSRLTLFTELKLHENCYRII